MGTLTKEQVTLPSDYNMASPYNIAYQTIYNNIRFSWDHEQRKQHTLALTTPASFPARSVAPTNVAIAAAQNGTPVLLVDADLSAPTLQQRLGTGAHTGLSELFDEETIVPRTIAPHLSKTFLPNLYLLGAGTTQRQPAEINRLFSTKMDALVNGLCQFLEETERQPGMIIFASPSVLSGIVASVISAVLDQTFLVIAAGRTTRAHAKRAQEQLERAHAKLAGVIMVDVS